MRGISGLVLLLLAACGERGAQTPEAATRQGIDRSVADIRAAEAAARAPAEASRSVGELTGKSAEKTPGSTKKAEAG